MRLKYFNLGLLSPMGNGNAKLHRILGLIEVISLEGYLGGDHKLKLNQGLSSLLTKFHTLF